MVYNRSGNPASDPRNLFKFGGIRLIKVDDSARGYFIKVSYGAVACTTNIRLVS